MGLNDAYEILLLLCVLGHVYCSNLLLGGFPVMVMTTWLGRGEGQVHLKDLAQKMRGSGLKVLGLAITLGFLLWLVMYNKHGEHMTPMMDAFQFGYGLLLILLLFASWGIYTYPIGNALISPNPGSHVLMVGGVMVCLLGITLLFVISHIIMLHPGYSVLVLEKGLFASITLPTVWPRFFHIVLGSVAATGIMITLYGTLRPSVRKEPDTKGDSSITPFDGHITRYGVTWTLAGTLPQIVVGPWLLFSLPDEVRMRLVDGASLSSLVFFVSLTFALFALVFLNASLMIPHVRGLVWTGLGSLFLTMVLMVMVREEVRKGWIQLSIGADSFEALSARVVWGVTMTSLLGFLIMGRIMRGRSKAKI